MNRIIYPFAAYPITGDVDSQPGSNRLTVVGLQTTPILAGTPVNGDFLVYQSLFSPNLNEWVPTAFGILKNNIFPSVSPAGILIIDASLGNSYRINVNQVISSSSITNANVDGQEITLLWVQDGTGHTISLPSNLKGATAPSITANSVSIQKFSYDLNLGNWYGIAAGQTGL